MFDVVLGTIKLSNANTNVYGCYALGPACVILIKEQICVTSPMSTLPNPSLHSYERGDLMMSII